MRRLGRLLRFRPNYLPGVGTNGYASLRPSGRAAWPCKPATHRLDVSASLMHMRHASWISRKVEEMKQSMEEESANADAALAQAEEQAREEEEKLTRARDAVSSIQFYGSTPSTGEQAAPDGEKVAIDDLEAPEDLFAYKKRAPGEEERKQESRTLPNIMWYTSVGLIVMGMFYGVRKLGDYAGYFRSTLMLQQLGAEPQMYAYWAYQQLVPHILRHPEVVEHFGGTVTIRREPKIVEHNQGESYTFLVAALGPKKRGSVTIHFKSVFEGRIARVQSLQVVSVCVDAFDGWQFYRDNVGHISFCIDEFIYELMSGSINQGY